MSQRNFAHDPTKLTRSAVQDEASQITSQGTTLTPKPEAMGYPAAWYFFCRERELRRGPIGKKRLNQELVAFLPVKGLPGILNSRCIHMAADLGHGEVVGDTLQCPLHNWCFDTEGHCTHIPTTDAIPKFARQTSYPTAVRHGNVYFFNGPEPLYPLPFFENLDESELVDAPPFIGYVDCPWYMVGANAVDVQHFAIAHDRRLHQPPTVLHPSPHAHKTIGSFEILGDSIFDAVTRKFGGSEAAFEICDWSSTMILTHSKLARAETYIILSMLPLSLTRTMVHVTVLARRGTSLAARFLDPLRARVRRPLIRRFLSSDIPRIAKTTFSPHTLIDIDQQFAEYFQWLATLPR